MREKKQSRNDSMLKKAEGSSRANRKLTVTVRHGQIHLSADLVIPERKIWAIIVLLLGLVIGTFALASPDTRGLFLEFLVRLLLFVLPILEQR